MTAHQAGTEAKRIPFGVHAVDDLVGVDPHALKHHRHLVHEGDVDIALAVLDELDRLRRLDRRDGKRAGLDDRIVNGFDLLERPLVHTGDNLDDIGQRVNLVAGVDALGRVGDIEVPSAHKAAFALEHGCADILRHAGIHGALVADDGTGPQVAPDGLARRDNGRKVGRLVAVDGRGDRDDDKTGLADARLVGGELHLRLRNTLVADLERRIVTGTVLLDLFTVDVETDNAEFLGESDRQRHTDIAEPHDGEGILATG